MERRTFFGVLAGAVAGLRTLVTPVPERSASNLVVNQGVSTSPYSPGQFVEAGRFPKQPGDIWFDWADDKVYAYTEGGEYVVLAHTEEKS